MFFWHALPPRNGENAHVHNYYSSIYWHAITGHDGLQRHLQLLQPPLATPLAV